MNAAEALTKIREILDEYGGDPRVHAHTAMQHVQDVVDELGPNAQPHAQVAGPSSSAAVGGQPDYMSRRFGRVPNGPATGKEPPRRGLSEAAEQLQPTGPGVRPSEAYPKWCVTCERYVPNEHFHDSERPAVGQSPACQHERVLTSVYCNDCETTVSIKAADGPTAGHIVAWAMQADNGTYYNLTWAEYAESADRMAARGFRALIDMERPADSNTTPEEG